MYTLMKPVGAALGAEFPLAGEHPTSQHLPQPPVTEGYTFEVIHLTHLQDTYSQVDEVNSKFR